MPPRSCRAEPTVLERPHRRAALYLLSVADAGGSARLPGGVGPLAVVRCVDEAASAAAAAVGLHHRRQRRLALARAADLGFHRVDGFNAHPLYTRIAARFQTTVSETTVRPSPTRVPRRARGRPCPRRAGARGRTCARAARRSRARAALRCAWRCWTAFEGACTNLACIFCAREVCKTPNAWCVFCQPNMTECK